MVSGIYYILRTGVPWRDLPAEFGPWRSSYPIPTLVQKRLWSRMLDMLTAHATGSIRCFDCTHIKVHQDGSNAVAVATATLASQQDQNRPEPIQIA